MQKKTLKKKKTKNRLLQSCMTFMTSNPNNFIKREKKMYDREKLKRCKMIVQVLSSPLLLCHSSTFGARELLLAPSTTRASGWPSAAPAVPLVRQLFPHLWSWH